MATVSIVWESWNSLDSNVNQMLNRTRCQIVCDFWQRHFLWWKTRASIWYSEHGITNWFWCSAFGLFINFGIGQFTQIVNLANLIPVELRRLRVLCSVFKIVETFYYIFWVNSEHLALCYYSKSRQMSSSHCLVFHPILNCMLHLGLENWEHLNTKHVFDSFQFHFIAQCMCCNAIITIPVNVPNGFLTVLKSQETLLKYFTVEVLAAGVEKSFSTLFKFNIYHKLFSSHELILMFRILCWLLFLTNEAKLFDEFAFPVWYELNAENYKLKTTHAHSLRFNNY